MLEEIIDELLSIFGFPAFRYPSTMGDTKINGYIKGCSICPCLAA
jgi:hypothetical protein